MKLTLIALLLAASSITVAQSREEGEIEKVTLAGTEWRTSFNAFSDEGKEEYNLTAFPEQADGQFSWGNSLSFKEEKFYTNYSAPCGVDCFTSVTGTYKFVGFNRIEVYVETINRSGFCSTKSEEPQKIFGVYLLSKTDNGIRIVKEVD